MFILDDNTDDDLFLLLAALHSGNHCQFLTNDYFRQHLHQIGKTIEPRRYLILIISALVDVRIARIFFQWQASHQIWIDRYQGYEGAAQSRDVVHSDPKLVWPQLHSSHAQTAGGTNNWHLPIRPQHNQNGFFLPSHWVCVKTEGSGEQAPGDEFSHEEESRNQRREKYKKVQISDLDLFKR